MTAPDSVHELARARQAARAEKNFALSDQLRDEIAAQGFEVVDVAGGYELRPKKRFPVYESTRDIRTINSGKYEITAAIIVEGFHEDAITCIKSIKAHSQCAIAVLVIGEPGDLVNELDARTSLVQVNENFGWGENANALLRNITSDYVIVLDPSTTFTGDAVTPVLEELKKRDFVAVGWRGGLVNLEDDWRSTDDKGPGEVDVLFSYFIAMHREDALAARGFSNRAVFYRNADIEFSLNLRHSNGRLLQMDLPLEQGRHHGYHDSDPEYRDAQSKKNYDRILERFRGKTAILSPRR
ncbi:Glycosyltransferase 2-like [Candidatus Nanopelagicaceae bacterium]